MLIDKAYRTDYCNSINQYNKIVEEEEDLIQQNLGCPMPYNLALGSVTLLVSNLSSYLSLRGSNEPQVQIFFESIFN